MKLKLTKLRIALLAVAGVLVIAVVGALLAIDPMVRKSVEEQAAKSLQVSTSLESATVHLSGEGSLDNFAAANPPGYKEPHAITVKQIEISARTGSLLSDEVEVHRITVREPVVTIEFSGTKSNWSVLMDRLSGKGATAPAPSTPTPTPAPQNPPPPAEPQPKKKTYKIALLRIEGGKVIFHSSLLPKGPVTVALPPIELKDVGGKDSKAQMDEVLAMIMQMVADAALAQGADLLPSDLRDAFSGEVGRASELFQGELDGVNKTISETLKKEIPGVKVPDVLDDATKKIKKIFD